MDIDSSNATTAPPPPIGPVRRFLQWSLPLASVVVALGYISVVHVVRYQSPVFPFRLSLEGRVTDVAPAIPGSADVRVGDRLVAVITPDGRRHRLRSAFHWVQLSSHLRVGDRLTLELGRAGQHTRAVVHAAPRPRWPSMAITLGSFGVIFLVSLFLWFQSRRRRPGIGWLIVVVINTYLVLYGFTRMPWLLAKRDLFLIYLCFDLFTLPLLLHLFLRYPVPVAWLERRRWRAVLLYVPQAAVAVITAIFFLRLSRNPDAAQQAEILLLSRRLLPLTFFVYFSAALGVMVYRFFTASPAVRRQIQWIMYGATVTALLTVIFIVVKLRGGFESFLFSSSEYLLLIYALLAFSIQCSFVSFRLVDVGRLVHRSLVYGVVTAFILLIYLGASAFLGLFVTRAFGVTSTTISILATIVAVGLFFPLRRAVQRNVDRMFYKNRTVYSDLLQQASSEFVTMLDLGQLSQKLLGMVEGKLRLRHAALYLVPRRRVEDAPAALQRVAQTGEPPPPIEALTFADSRLDLLRERAMADNVAVSARHSAHPVEPDEGDEGAPDPAEALLTELDASMVVFLEVRRDFLGLLVLGPKRDESLVSLDEVDTLEALGRQLSVVVKNAAAYTEIERLSLDLRRRQKQILELKNRLEAENVYLRGELKSAARFGDIVGESAALGAVLARVEKVAETEVTVLIRGESGTGKELIARAIHQASARRDRPLVTINCAAIPEGLLESELFGHAKGAFTGAVARQRGRFELADGGTLFLDEVGDLPLSLQPKLLRALQEREITPVGDEKTRSVDVRVIAATNRDLAARVESGAFREDLFYRLNVVPIDVPPLRERTGDIPLLANYFLALFSRRTGKEVTAISKHAMDRLCRYPWPGNVRELQNTIERAVVLTERAVVDEGIVLPEVRPSLPEASADEASLPAGDDVLDPYHDAVSEFKRRYLERAIERHGGNRAAAARELGLQRTYLYRLIKQLGVSGG